MENLDMNSKHFLFWGVNVLVLLTSFLIFFIKINVYDLKDSIFKALFTGFQVKNLFNY